MRAHLGRVNRADPRRPCSPRASGVGVWLGPELAPRLLLASRYALPGLELEASSHPGVGGFDLKYAPFGVQISPRTILNRGRVRLA